MASFITLIHYAASQDSKHPVPWRAFFWCFSTQHPQSRNGCTYFSCAINQSDSLLFISIPCCIPRWAFVGISNQSSTDDDRIVRACNSGQPVYSFCSSAFFGVRTILRSIILHANFAFTCGCICVCTSSMIYMKPVSGAEKNKVKKAV